MPGASSRADRRERQSPRLDQSPSYRSCWRLMSRFGFVDLPAIEGATGKFLLHQMASVAELEAGMISDRTKKALAAAKVRGVVLGGFRGRAGTSADCARARKARTLRARDHAASLAPIFTRLDPAGSLSLRALAAKLTAESLPTPAGGAEWSAATVARVKSNLAAQ